MKIFNSIKDAVSHQETCPICKSSMIIESSSCPNEIIKHNNNYLFSISSKMSNVLVVDVKTEKVSLQNINDNKFKKHINFNGQFWSSLNISCNECYKYSFIIQIKFDLNDIKIINISLQSESITFEENDLITELRNKYSPKETWIITYSGNSTKTTKLPLIDINLNNPQETLNRVNKLILFS